MQVKSISVKFGATIPTQAYGGIRFDTQWDVDLEEGETPEQATQDIFGRIREEMTRAVMPIAVGKLNGIEAALRNIPTRDRDAIMQQIGIMQWLQTVAPATLLAKLETITREEVNGDDNADQGSDEGHTEHRSNGSTADHRAAVQGRAEEASDA